MKAFLRITVVALLALVLSAAMAPCASGQGLSGGGGFVSDEQDQSQQSGGSAQPPPPAAPANPPLWVYFLLMTALTAGTVFISIMPSKRGHQD